MNNFAKRTILLRFIKIMRQELYEYNVLIGPDIDDYWVDELADHAELIQLAEEWLKDFPHPKVDFIFKPEDNN